MQRELELSRIVGVDDIQLHTSGKDDKRKKSTLSLGGIANLDYKCEGNGAIGHDDLGEGVANSIIFSRRASFMPSHCHGEGGRVASGGIFEIGGTGLDRRGGGTSSIQRVHGAER